MRRVAGRQRVQPGWQLAAAALALLGAALAHPSARAQDAEATMLAQAAPAAARLQPRLSLVLAPPLPGEVAGGLPGVRWRQLLGGQVIDITAWRRLAPPSDAATLIQQREPAAFGARVEMRIAPSRGLVADYKFLGLQLDSGARIGLRRQYGGPTLYYRSQF